MSRPIRRSAEYGLMPGSGSVVECWKNSGTICAGPAMLTTTMVQMISQPTFFSSVSCEKLRFSDMVLSWAYQWAVAGRLAGIGASTAGRPTIVLATL